MTSWESNTSRILGNRRGGQGSPTFETHDGLLRLLTEIRKQLIACDDPARYTVWEVYGCSGEEEEEEESEVPARPAGEGDWGEDRRPTAGDAGGHRR